MRHEIYNDLYIKEGYNVFEFFSIGRKGVILKRVAFIPGGDERVYNLVFGDVNADGEIDDQITSNNGDRNKILATVIHVIDSYLTTYPDRVIFFTGSTMERTRLYRMVIGLHYEELSEKFEIYCQIDIDVIPFEKNIPAKHFLIRKKP